MISWYLCLWIIIISLIIIHHTNKKTKTDYDKSIFWIIEIDSGKVPGRKLSIAYLSYDWLALSQSPRPLLSGDSDVIFMFYLWIWIINQFSVCEVDTLSEWINLDFRVNFKVQTRFKLTYNCPLLVADTCFYVKKVNV